MHPRRNMKTYSTQSTMTSWRKQEIENNKQKWKKGKLPTVKRYCIDAPYFSYPLHSSLKSYFWKARAIYYLGCREWIYQASVVFLCSVKISFPIFLRIQGKIIISMTHSRTSSFLGRLFLVQSDWRVLIPPTRLPVWHFLTFLNNSSLPCQLPTAF